MKPRAWALSFLAFNMVVTSVSRAQMQMPQQMMQGQQGQWGTGMWGGNQSCPYNYGAANGAVDESDDIREMEDLKRDLKRDLRDAERELRDADSSKDKYAATINEVFRPVWADTIISHMDNGYNCYRGPGDVMPPDSVYQPPTVIYKDPPAQLPEDRPAMPRPPSAKPRHPQPSSDNTERAKADRMPAQASPETGYAPSAGSNNGVNPYDRDLGPAGGDATCGTVCAPVTLETSSRRWGQYCGDGGQVRKNACSDRVLVAEIKGKRADCERAISEYRKKVRQSEALQNKISNLKDQIERLTAQIRELKRDMKYDREGRLEAGCPTGDCPRSRPRAEPRGPSLLSTLLPLGIGILGGAAAEYFGYRANMQNNTNLNKMGWPTQPYQVGSYGFPFFASGLYGSVLAGTMGGFGCAGGFGGGGPMGPYGMMGPGGFNGMNSPFGYPSMFGMNPMGGGMYAPGMGPWGMSGPWGNGYANPYFGGPGMGFAMPGMGFAGGMAGGFGMAMPGMGMAGGYGMAMPGMGMAGGFAGGFGMAMPGMGMAGGYGMAMPGMGMAGGIGLAGGLGMAMPIGMAGGYGMAMPMGMVGGYGMAMPMGGYGMAMPMGMAGGFGMAMGGVGAGFAIPGGGIGGMASPGMPGLAGGYGGGFGSPYGMGYGSPYGMGMGMMGQSPYYMQARAQQNLMTEYYSLMYRMNQVNTGFMGGMGYGMGYGMGVMPYGLGINTGFGLGGSFSTTPLRTR